MPDEAASSPGQAISGTDADPGGGGGGEMMADDSGNGASKGAADGGESAGGSTLSEAADAFGSPPSDELAGPGETGDYTAGQAPDSSGVCDRNAVADCAGVCGGSAALDCAARATALRCSIAPASAAVTLARTVTDFAAATPSRTAWACVVAQRWWRPVLQPRWPALWRGGRPSAGCLALHAGAPLWPRPLTLGRRAAHGNARLL